MIKNYFYFCFLLMISIVLTNCAQELNPTGGERDKIPPKVVKTNPENETVNYTGQVLKFTFDEPIQKPDIKKDIFISPFVNRPKVTVSDNGKRMTLNLQEDLRSQTTYVITLNGIKDLRERNQIEEPYTLAFSTGDQLDSLELQGVIEDTEGKGVEDMLVLLFDADSVIGNDIFRKRPAYLSRTDTQGKFSFKFLRSASYRVFGLTDGDQSNTYSSVSEAVAMAADSVLLLNGDTTNLDVVKLVSFVVDESPPRLRRFYWTTDSTLAIQLSEALNLSGTNIFATDTLRSDTFKIDQISYIPGADKELWLHIPGGKRWLDIHLMSLSDSIGNAEDSIMRVNPDKDKEWKTPLQTAPKLRLDLPAIEFLAGKHVAATDQTLFSLTDTASADSNRQTFTLEWSQDGFYQRITPMEKEAEGIPLILRIDRSFFYAESDTLFPDTVFTYPVTWLKPENYGRLTGTVIPDSSYDGTYVVQMKGASGVVRSFSDTAFSFQNLEAGDYSFEVIYDADGNGILTTGSLIQYRLPERRKSIPGSISIRANWDFEDHVVDLNATEPEPVETVEEEETEPVEEN